MTQWVTDPTGGRQRGPRGLARAWVEVVFRPHRFFKNGISPGDQAPGLTFAMTVVLVEETLRLSLVPSAVPMIAGSRFESAVLAVMLAVLLVTPAVLHLFSGLQTLILIPFVDERGGVGETVQVLAYATAPCVLAGLPIPALQVVCAIYGASLYLIGLATVHGLDGARSVLYGLLPAWLTFAWAFRGLPALVTLLEGWHVI